jgi:hypothetical protein
VTSVHGIGRHRGRMCHVRAAVHVTPACGIPRIAAGDDAWRARCRRDGYTAYVVTAAGSVAWQVPYTWHRYPVYAVTARGSAACRARYARHGHMVCAVARPVMRHTLRASRGIGTRFQDDSRPVPRKGRSLHRSTRARIGSTDHADRTTGCRRHPEDTTASSERATTTPPRRDRPYCAGAAYSVEEPRGPGAKQVGGALHSP